MDKNNDPKVKKNIDEAAKEIQKILEDRGLSMVPTLTILPAKKEVDIAKIDIAVAGPAPIIKPGDDILSSTEMYEGPGDPIGVPDKGGILG